MDALSDLKWLIIVIIIIWFMWFFTGGPSRERSQFGLFLKAPSPLDTGEAYGELPGSKKKPQILSSKNSKYSIFRDEILIDNTNNAKKINPNKEYIELKASNTNKSPVYITNWFLKNSAGIKASIGKASNLPYSGRINNEESLFLSNGEKAIISTGRSPIGVSFRVNKCSSYLEQFQEFSPQFKYSCPSIVNDIQKNRQDFNTECTSYISTLPSCNIYTNEIPSNLSNSCRSYIRNQINYNSCVDVHKNDTDFYKPEWRIFLGENNEMWNNSGDLIRLYDQAGNLVDSSSY
jgi:hypothetical protein